MKSLKHRVGTVFFGLLAFIGGPAMAERLPPNVDRDPDLHVRLEAAYRAKGAGYVPRTHLLENGRARYVNRLIEEVSPYLLQHAHNPVDWHPWSEETLARAARLDKPIFLSVGYATCHWCHVMEEESFDNEEVAALLNRHFIAVKIDREEMPGLDHIYITATQLQQGQAGWPNSVFLLPDGRPFHTGTYMPPDHFTDVVAAIGHAWADPGNRAEIDTVASELTAAVQRITQMSSRQSAALDETVFLRAAQSLLDAHNALEGGFSQSQQFPQEGFLLYLMDHWRRTGDEASLQAAVETLHAIAAGGIHDHVGGGFHRYTVDPNWRTPHFEKMLYNQGLLARAFLEAWEITEDETFRRAARRTFAYLARDMTDGSGAFYAAEDADSLTEEGVRTEGAFYVFTAEEAAEIAGPHAAALLGLDQPPTLEAGAVIHLDPTDAIDSARIDPVLEAFRLARQDRARPLRDEKVIAGWNGLVIRALSDGAVVLDDPVLSEQAMRAADTLWARLWQDGRLKRLWVGGEAREEGALEDYAWLALGFLALGDASGDAVWQDRATVLADEIWTRFGDDAGRLKMAAVDGPLGPIYDSADGAVPSGESSALELLARLSRRSQDPEHHARAERLRAALAAPLVEQPLSRPDALTASRILDDGESGYRRSAARGQLRVHLRQDELRIDIAEGWHLNAHDPGQDWLIGVSLEGARADWPEGRLVTLGFSDQVIRVYEGRLEVALTDTSSGEITLRAQACSDSICLEPEDLSFRLP